MSLLDNLSKEEMKLVNSLFEINEHLPHANRKKVLQTVEKNVDQFVTYSDAWKRDAAMQSITDAIKSEAGRPVFFGWLAVFSFPVPLVSIPCAILSFLLEERSTTPAKIGLILTVGTYASILLVIAS